MVSTLRSPKVGAKVLFRERNPVKQLAMTPVETWMALPRTSAIEKGELLWRTEAGFIRSPTVRIGYSFPSREDPSLGDKLGLFGSKPIVLTKGLVLTR